MTAIRFDPWAELAVLETADCGGAAAKVAKLAKVAPLSNVPVQWIDGVDRLSTLLPPIIVRRQRWRLAIRDARRLLRDWGEQAAALGWGTLDIFGAPDTPRAAD